ncbi:MAG: hypothetical protein IT391_14395 [Nitrospira sp.]|nr:hypothetical protein [Nitrospira sp.]
MLHRTLLAMCFVIGGLVSYASAETPESALGRRIFEQGIGRDGRQIGGRIHGNVFMRGQAVACAACHGKDARGGGEAFVRAPDIRWHTLNKPFAPRRAGLPRPSYDQATFARAIQQGIASNGVQLEPAMPRFDLSQDETAALVRHLQTGEWLPDGEVSSKVVLGLLPASQSERWAQELGDRLHSCPSSDSLAGFPPLEIIPYTDPPDALTKLAAKISEGRVSYILAPYIAGWEDQYFEAARDWPVPSLLPVTPLDSPAHPNFTFSLPGLGSQVVSLLERGVSGRYDVLTVVRSEGDLLSREMLKVVRREARMRNVRLDEVTLERSHSIEKWALWLILAPLDNVAKQLRNVRHKVNRTALVPAMFFDPAAARRIEKQMPGIAWQIAYPYVPVNTRTGRWRSPLEAWAEAGCALLAKIGEEHPGGVSGQSSIVLESGLTLSNAHDDMSRRRQVIVAPWEQRKALQ